MKKPVDRLSFQALGVSTDPIRQTPIPDVRLADPFYLSFPISQSGFIRLFQLSIGINVESKEVEKREKKHGKMKAAKPERVAFNPQVSIRDMMIGKEIREGRQQRHVAYHCGLTL